MAKDANYIKLINCSKWRKLRLSKIQANPLCEQCQTKDKLTPATAVHHITFVESVPTISQMHHLMYDYKNLMSVCKECHKNIHFEAFSHSKENVKRANMRRSKRFTDRYLRTP